MTIPRGWILLSLALGSWVAVWGAYEAVRWLYA